LNVRSRGQNREIGLNVTRLRGLPLYRALDRAIASGRYRAEQEHALRVHTHNLDVEIHELARPLSSFVERDESGHVVDYTDLHMIRFVRMAGRAVTVRDEELRERCRVFGMDDAGGAWADLPPEVRRRALRYRREALELARRAQFALPEQIKPATWRKWKQRARALGFTFEPLEVSGELHPKPYTGTRWR
jgi:hypothetical protein